MNVLFLNSLSKAKWGGGEKWMINAGAGLKDRGHKVTIACLPGSVIEQNAKAKDLDIFHFGVGADIAFWKIPFIKKYLKNNKIDALICCQNKDVKIGALAGRKANIPAIFARQGLMNIKNKSSHKKPFTQYIDGIITNTTSIQDAYMSYGWFTNDFIHVIYNGIDVPETTNTIDLHQKYDLPENSKTIISAGRLDHQKGFDLLIKVAELARAQHLNWSFVVVGKGKSLAELQKMTEEMNVSDIFKFAGFSTDVLSLVRSADVFVLPSRYEGMPNALLEAMAVGKACVSTNVNGAPELIEDGISGLLTETEDFNQIFNQTKKILEDDKLKESLEKNALERVRNHFSMNKMIDDLEDLLTKKINS